MLIKEALSILQKANTKIAELGTQVADPDMANSPQLPALESQLNDCVNLFDLILKFVILNDAGTAIEGNNADNDAVVNSLLIQLQEVGELNSLVLPSPIVTIVVTETGSGGSFPAGASEGDLVYFHNGSWVRFAKGSDGQSLVSTALSIQWQSQVGNGIPGGGSINQFLKKNSNTPYDVAWSGIATTDITGLTALAAELNILNGATFSTAEANRLTGLTGGSLQSQLAAKLGTGLTSGSFLVGVAGVATALAPTGDVTFNTSGVFAIGAGVIVDTDINASAAIARTKLASGNNYRLVTNGAAGAMTDAAAITASRVLISDANGIPTHSTIPEINITYLDATSSIQTQLDSKLTAVITTPAQGDMLFFNGTNWVNFTVGTNGQLLSSDGNVPVWVTDPPTGLPSGGTTAQYLRKINGTDYNAEWHTLIASDITDISATAAEINILSGVTVTNTKINYLTDVTSNIQAQFIQKLDRALTENYMFIGNASNVAIPFATGTDGYILTSVGGVPTWSAPGSGGTVTSIQVAGGATGLTFSGGPVTTTGTITMAGTLDADNGGTGQSSYTVGDILYASTTTALSKLAAGTSTYVLTSNGAGVAPSWQVAAGIGGSTGSVDNSLLRANGTGGSTAQAGSLWAISDFGNATIGAGSAITQYYIDTDGSANEVDLRLRSKRASAGAGFTQFYVNGSSNSCGITDGTELVDFVLSSGLVHIASGAALEIEAQNGDFVLRSYNNLYLLPSDGGVGSIGLFTTSGSFGSGDGVLFMANALTVPSTNPTGGVILYAEGGALKCRGASGTITTVGPA